MGKLAESIIKDLEPREKVYSVWDGEGLYLEIAPNGAKRWRTQYAMDGRKRVVAHGVWPKVSLKEARARHLEARPSSRAFLFFLFAILADLVHLDSAPIHSIDMSSIEWRRISTWFRHAMKRHRKRLCEILGFFAPRAVRRRQERKTTDRWLKSRCKYAILQDLHLDKSGRSKYCRAVRYYFV